MILNSIFVAAVIRDYGLLEDTFVEQLVQLELVRQRSTAALRCSHVALLPRLVAADPRRDVRSNLQTVGENKERLVLLKLAKERNMDVQAITASIVDTMSKSSSSSSSAIDTSLSSNNLQNIQQQQQQQTQLNDDDMRRVNAIEWIVYDVA